MRVLLVGVAADDELVPALNAVSRPDAAVSVAAVKYTRVIYEGFRHHLGDDCTGVALVPVGMFPASRILWWRGRERAGWHYLPFVNLLLVKQLSIALALGWFTWRWARRDARRDRLVVLTSIYLPFLAPFRILKRRLGLRLVSFVPDLPEFEFTYAATTRSLKQRLVPAYVRVTRALYDLVDHFVFITDAMRAKFEPRPFTVIEGFVDAAAPAPAGPAAAPTEERRGARAVMYSGALYQKFGIGTLIDAFRGLPGDVELWLFGSGEMVEPAREAAALDPRIKVFGNVPNAEVLAYQRRATLLVNPRPTDNEFTRFSFPSKLLEYLASGRPVLTTRLAGIPADYEGRLWFIDDESVEGMREALRRCLARGDAELDTFGRRAAEWVRAEKTNTRRVGMLLERLREPGAVGA